MRLFNEIRNNLCMAFLCMFFLGIAIKSLQYTRTLITTPHPLGYRINTEPITRITFPLIPRSHTPERTMWKIYKENSEDLNFTLKCLFSEAITIEEFQQWVERVISELSIDDIPLYFFDLLEFNDSLFKIIKVIGFSSVGHLTEDENKALYGIIYLRNIKPYEKIFSKKVALKALKRNPHIYQRFKDFFPFIELPPLSALDDFT